MFQRYRTSLVACALLMAPLSAAAAPDGANLARIADEGFNRSEVMTTAEWLADRIGGRLTNSPAMRTAEAWTQARFRAWGLTNVHREGFAFGRGWSIDRASVRMTAPRVLALHAIPVAWTPATNGPLSGPIIVAPLTSERDFARYTGKLAGKIVLVSLPGDGSEPGKPAFERLSGEEIAKLDAYEQPTYDPDKLARAVKRFHFGAFDIDAFAKREGALAVVRQSYSDGGLLHGEGYQHERGAALPTVELAAEDYRRLARLAKTGPVTLEIDSVVRFHDADPQAYNVIADLPGTDQKAGYLMAGAHLDSWVAADGAADNGAGSAIVMEAARILSRLGVRPRRTIRFALWAGEEQGLIGSKAYVERHIASRPPNPDPNADSIAEYFGWTSRYPVTKLADYDRLAAYFNIDNGSGKLRGIYAEGNFAAIPALRELSAPLASLGADRVVAAKTDSTDHVFMASVGLPAFQFIQDPLDYESRVHHSSIDTFDHLKADDMRQAAVVLATVLLETANRAEPLPRTPLPTAPTLTAPFGYADPAEDR